MIFVWPFPCCFSFFYIIFLSWECVISSVLSHHNKNLNRRDVKALRQTMFQLSDRSVLQLHVTAQFYLESSRKIHPRGMRACRPKDMKRRERERERASVCTQERERRPPPRTSGFSFYMSFLPRGLPYVNWARQDCCLFYLRSSLRSADLPLFYFLRLFPSLFF